MRRRGGAHVRSEPDPEYWDFDGAYHLGTVHGLAQPFDLTDAECEAIIAEQRARDARRIRPGFALPETRLP